MRLLLLPVFFILLLLQVACKKYVPADSAFFLKPNLISVSTTTAQGSGSHKITDLWVYVDGFFKGVYPVESTVPIVTKDKSVSINIFAGIKNNGIKDTRISYPFYEILKLDTFVERGVTVNRPLTFKYKTATTFTWTEGFEGQAYSLIKSSISDTGFTVKSDAESLEGKFLHLRGSNTATLLQVESSESGGFALPISNSNVYLEINYKCNSNVTVGLIGDGGVTKETFYLNPQPSWNKIYIALGATVNQAPVSSKHKVFFRMLKTEIGTVPELYLDNIKLVYLQ